MTEEVFNRNRQLAEFLLKQTSFIGLGLHNLSASIKTKHNSNSKLSFGLLSTAMIVQEHSWHWFDGFGRTY